MGDADSIEDDVQHSITGGIDQARDHADGHRRHDQGQDRQHIDGRAQPRPPHGAMHEQREAQAEEDLDGEDDQRVHAGGADRLVEQRVAEGPRVIDGTDESSVLCAQRLDDDEHKGDRHDHEHGTQGRQEDQVRETLVATEPPPRTNHIVNLRGVTSLLHCRADLGGGGRQRVLRRLQACHSLVHRRSIDGLDRVPLVGSRSPVGLRGQ